MGSSRKHTIIKIALCLSPFLALAVYLVFVLVVQPALANVDKGAYVAQNEALLQTVPVFRGSHLVGSDSYGIRDPRYGWGENGGPYRSYFTSHTYRLPTDATCQGISSYYASTLPGAGWRLELTVGAYDRVYRKGGALLGFACSPPPHGSWLLEIDYAEANNS